MKQRLASKRGLVYIGLFVGLFLLLLIICPQFVAVTLGTILVWAVTQPVLLAFGLGLYLRGIRERRT